MDHTTIDFSDLPVVDAGTPEIAQGPRKPRFEQDSSTLDNHTCWALQNLLSRRYISKEHEPELWSWMCQSRDVLASRLSELDLVLIVDDDIEYAYIEQADYESPWGRKLLRKETLNTYDSLLALHLTRLVRAAPDLKVLISREDIHTLFAGINNETDRDDSRLTDRVNGAIRRLTEVKLLISVDTETFTVSPVILSVMTGARIEQLQTQFEALRTGARDRARGGGQ